MPGRVLYSMSVSLDGFAARLDGSIDWVIVDEELHQAFNDESREVDLFLYGRRMYELMVAYWPFALDDPDATPVERDFALLFRDTPKLVFARSMDAVEHGCELADGDVVDVVRRLRTERRSMGVGGPTLAATLFAAGLIDEVTMYVNPVVLGAGLPFFPALPESSALHLVDVRRFEAGVVRLRYAVGPTAP